MSPDLSVLLRQSEQTANAASHGARSCDPGLLITNGGTVTRSCSDFCDDILGTLLTAGVLRDADVPPDDPTRQADLAVAAVQTLLQVNTLAQALSRQLLADASTPSIVREAVYALLRAAERLDLRWLVCDGTAGSVTQEDCVTRWVMDLQTGELVRAQALRRGNWHDLPHSEVALLSQRLSCQGVRLYPAEHGAQAVAQRPAWA